MQVLIERLYGDFLERKLPELTQRIGDFREVRGKALALIGMRRSGKTWLCYQLMDNLLKTGTPKERIFYLNFEDDRLYHFQLENCQTILDVFYGANPAKKDVRCHFFFDEIQNIPGWERFIRRILDTEKASVYVTGSSARLLSAEIATGLRGRSLDREVFPFSFAEFLSALGIEYDLKTPGAKGRLLLQQKAREYLQVGGFPEVIEHDPQRRCEILQSYIDAVILRDVVERHGVRNIEVLRALVHHILRNPATQLSIHKFYRDVKSRGLRIGKDDLYAFSDHLADAYLLFPVPLWTRSETKRQANPKKIYLVDSGLAHAWSVGITPDYGASLENVVFLGLRRRGISPGYYLTKTGKEVDFAYRSGDQTTLIQVAWTLENDETRKRELRALKEASDELKNAKCTLVTLADEGTEAEGKVKILPLWKFLLDPNLV